MAYDLRGVQMDACPGVHGADTDPEVLRYGLTPAAWEAS